MTPEHIAATNRANLIALANLTRKAFDGVEKLMELNLQVAKTVMSENVEHLQESAHAKDVKELLALQANFVQPLAEKAVSYSRHLYQIANDTQSALTDGVRENIQERSTQLQSLISEMTQGTPGSTEAISNIIKQAMTNANTVFESTQKAIKQATDMSSHQVQTATESALKASEQLFKKAVAN